MNKNKIFIKSAKTKGQLPRILTISFLFFMVLKANGQGDIIHYTSRDTSFIIRENKYNGEGNDGGNSGIVIEPFGYLKSGVRIIYDSTLKKMLFINFFSNGELNGRHMTFHKNSLPNECGNYLAGQKDGEWYYWSDKGKLIRLERWIKGSLISSEVDTP